MIALHAIMAELDLRAYWRIQPTMKGDFEIGCIRPDEHIRAVLKERGLPVDPTAGQLIDSHLRHYGLDRSLPRWGLAELPELDFAVHSLNDWWQAFFSLPKEVYSHPFNQLLWAAYMEYLQDFDLSTPEAREIATLMFNILTNWNELDKTIPIMKILDQLAAEEGLKRK